MKNAIAICAPSFGLVYFSDGTVARYSIISASSHLKLDLLSGKNGQFKNMRLSNN